MPALGLKLRISKIKARIAAVVTDGLALWHKMTANTWDGSTDRLPDSSANSNTAALHTGRGLSLDGVNDVVTVGATGVTVKTVVFYAYPDTTTEAFMQLQASGAVRIEIASGTLSATGFTSPTLYVDGAAGSTVAATTWQQIAVTSATGVSASNVLLGQSNTTYLSGDLSNVKMFSVELSAGQIAELFANPEQALPTGVSASELVGWWPLADGSVPGIALDGSGNGNHGTIAGATFVGALPSPVNQVAFKGSTAAMWFDETNDVIKMGDVLDLGTNDMTLLSWYFTSNVTNDDSLIGKYDSGDSHGFNMYFSASGYPRAEIKASGTRYSTGTFAAYSAKTVHCQAATYDRDGNLISYMNGSSYATVSILAADGVDIQNARELKVGNAFVFSDKYFGGIIFVSAIFDKVLTAAEITQIYNGGVNFDLTTDSGDYVSSANLQGYWKNTGNTNADWVDLSANSNNGTVNGSPTTIYLPEGLTAGKDILGGTLKNVNTGELIVRGDGYVSTADDATLDVTTAVTVEAWVKPFSVSSAQTIIGKNGSYSLSINASAKPVFTKWTSTTPTATATTSTTVTANVWAHLAATYDGTNVKIYINGALDTTTAVSGAMDATSADVLMGALTTSTELFNGYIDSVKVYNDDLTADDILANYNAELADHS